MAPTVKSHPSSMMVNATANLSNLRSGLVCHATQHNANGERQRFLDYVKLIDKMWSNPMIKVDGPPPDYARKIKKAKLEPKTPRLNNENSAPNPRAMPASHFMSPIAEDGDDNERHQPDALVNPPSAHKTDQLVQSMTVLKLRKELKKRGKETNGLKRELQCRLAQAIREKRREEAAIALQQAAAAAQEEPPMAVNSNPIKVIEFTSSTFGSTNFKAANAPEEKNLPGAIFEQHPVGRCEDVEMVDAPAAARVLDRKASEKMDAEDNCEPPAHGRAKPSSGNESDTMDIDLSESNGKASPEIVLVPTSQPNDNVEANEPPRLSRDLMDVEQNGSRLEVASDKFLPSWAPGIGSASKVLDLVEVPIGMSAEKMKSAPVLKKPVADQPISASPCANKTKDEEDSKQVLMSLKKWKVPQKAKDSDSKPPENSSSSAYKVSNLASLRSEQKASLKVADQGESFLVKAIKVAPLGLSTSSKPAADEARQARLAEMRGKSKPVALTKPIETTSKVDKTFASLKSKAAVTKDDRVDQKRKLLAAQMREKTAAAAAATAAQKQDNGGTIPKKVSVEQPSQGEKSAAVVEHRSTPKEPKATLPKVEQPMQPCSSVKKAATEQSHHRREDIFSPMSTYEISDRENSDSEDEDIDDDDSEAQNAKKIPKWARKEYLEPALAKQYQDNNPLDPDEIFHEISTCDLEAVFESKKAKFRKRTSSGNWTLDRVTPAEQLAYKRAMGYKKG